MTTDRDFGVEPCPDCGQNCTWSGFPLRRYNVGQGKRCEIPAVPNCVVRGEDELRRAYEAGEITLDDVAEAYGFPGGADNWPDPWDEETPA